MRIGHGYDVHRLVFDRPLVLGGILIPFERGLLGHSDADVLLHAIIDALLGAAGLSDIGLYFPDTKEEYRNIDSILLLEKTKALLEENGMYKIVNIDVTVIAQAPKLRPYIESMRQNIAECLSMSAADINVKATTEEGLGFTGTGKGIAAHAVCLIEQCYDER